MCGRKTIRIGNYGTGAPCPVRCRIPARKPCTKRRTALCMSSSNEREADALSPYQLAKAIWHAANTDIMCGKKTARIGGYRADAPCPVRSPIRISGHKPYGTRRTRNRSLYPRSLSHTGAQAYGLRRMRTAAPLDTHTPYEKENQPCWKDWTRAILKACSA